MCDYRKLSKWLVIVPFCVLHIVGARSVVSSFLLKNIFPKSLLRSNFSKNKCSIEDMLSSTVSYSKEQESVEFDKIYFDDSENNFINNFNDRIKGRCLEKKEIAICDNRIDYIDQEFIENSDYKDNFFQTKSLTVFA